VLKNKDNNFSLLVTRKRWPLGTCLFLSYYAHIFYYLCMLGLRK